MFTLRCTKKLLDRLGDPAAGAGTPATTRLGDWYANLLFTKPEHLVIAVSERTLLPVIAPAAPAATLFPRLVSALGVVLGRLGIPNCEIHAEQGEMAEVAIGKTADRRVLGIMNEFAFMMQHNSASSLDELAHWLSEVPTKHGFPNQMTRLAFLRNAKQGARAGATGDTLWEPIRTPSKLSAAEVLAHTNRKGVPFYLHQGTTQMGRPKYFAAKTIGAGALSAMPAGFEFGESINGVVSVRRIDTGAKLIKDADIEIVRTEVARHDHLRNYRVEARGNEIIVYGPQGALAGGDMQRLARELGLSEGMIRQASENAVARARYEPVMKFVMEPPARPGDYLVMRMTYRGSGGWSWSLAQGRLTKLAKDFIPPIGTEGFFDLM